LCVVLSVVLLVPAWALWTLRTVFVRGLASREPVGVG
jgi:hypothetical protein